MKRGKLGFYFVGQTQNAMPHYCFDKIVPKILFLSFSKNSYIKLFIQNKINYFHIKRLYFKTHAKI